MVKPSPPAETRGSLLVLSCSKGAKTQLAPTPIIALTGTAAPKEFNDLEQAGITDHLIKPFENETLEALLRKHLSN